MFDRMLKPKVKSATAESGRDGKTTEAKGGFGLISAAPTVQAHPKLTSRQIVCLKGIVTLEHLQS